MNKIEWQTYLQSQQVQFCEHDPLIIESITTSDDQASAFITPLLYQGVLSVIGPDSGKFLQGQLTCDINSATPEQTILGAACSPQGRIFSSFRVFQTHDKSGYLLRMRSDLVNPTLETIHKYSVFFKTELSNAEDKWFGLGIWGDDSEAIIQQNFNIQNLPNQPGQSVNNESLLIVRLPGKAPRYECWIKGSNIESAWTNLTQQATPTSNYPWLQQDIEAGIAEVSQAIEGEFNPHMLNFQLVDAVSFDKGCYTGQEIVARTHYRGKSKRLMKRFHLTGDAPLSPGTELHDASSEKTIATIVCAAPLLNEPGCQEALMVVNAELDTSTELSLTHNSHSLLARVQTLPYNLEGDS